MAAAQTRGNAARWTVALAVGLRQSEALALQWNDVDLDKGTLSVRRGLHRVSGHGLVYEEPKADRSRRTLALPTPLVEALRAHRAAQLEQRITAGPLWEDHDLVFAQPNGQPIERKLVAVKAAYGLWMTQAEKDAVAAVLTACPEQPLPGRASAVGRHMRRARI